MEKSWFILHYEVNDNKKESPKKNKIGILLHMRMKQNELNELVNISLFVDAN